MANPEHLEILKSGVEAWNRWRKQHIRDHVDLSNADLSELHRQWYDSGLTEGKLCGVNFESVALNGANLLGVDLTGAKMWNAQLEGANLQCATIYGAGLAHANLQDADLSCAQIASADFTQANLANTSLRKADLNSVNLHGARLDGTDFTKASLFGVSWTDVDLSNAIGLETLVHFGPSPIGIETLFKSSRKVPDTFLRGCGLPEDFINYLPSFLNQPVQFYSCFISYSHEDKVFARLLHDRLQGQGIRCWLDEHQLLPGDDIHDRIDQGIRLWDKVLLCASKSSLTSWWVDGEINRAFQKEATLMKERGKKVLAMIPLNLDGFLFSDDYQSGKKSEIKSRVAANFVGWEKDHALFDRELEKVIRALRTDDAGREKPPASRL
jgi:hypothetical protein